MWVRFPPGTYSVPPRVLDDARAIALPRTSIDSFAPALSPATHHRLDRLCRRCPPPPFPPGTYSVPPRVLDDTRAIALPRTSIDSFAPALSPATHHRLDRLCRRCPRLHPCRGHTRCRRACWMM